MKAELIDTQWDVNKHGEIRLHYSLTELIDTQWDVNPTNITARSG